MIRIGTAWTDEDKKVFCKILAKAEKWMLKCSIKRYYRELGTKRWFYYMEVSSPDNKKYIWPEYFEDVDARRVYQRMEWILPNDAILYLADTPDLAPFFDPDISKVFDLISSTEKARN